MNHTFEWHPDRRRAPRVDLLAELQGHLVTLDELVQVKQLSLGGLVVETTAPLSPRHEHDLRITFGEKAALVRVRVIHTRVALVGEAVIYISGLQLVDPSPDVVAMIRGFLDGLVPGTERA